MMLIGRCRTEPGRWEEPLNRALASDKQLIFRGLLNADVGILHMGCLLDLLTGKWYTLGWGGQRPSRLGLWWWQW